MSGARHLDRNHPDGQLLGGGRAGCCDAGTPTPADVHALLDQGVGLLECARRLGWSPNTSKRYTRAQKVEELLRPPRYGACLVGTHRDLVRRRLAEKLPVTRILAENREQGYTGSANLLIRYINQGRADPERVAPSPRGSYLKGLEKDRDAPSGA